MEMIRPSSGGGDAIQSRNDVADNAEKWSGGFFLVYESPRIMTLQHLTLRDQTTSDVDKTIC